MWSPVLVAALALTSTAGKSGDSNSVEISGTAALATSENFHVESSATRCDARDIARRCEQWRRYLQAKWMGKEHRGAWKPRCTLVIHGQRGSYQAAIGRGLDRSFGSSLVNRRDGRISERRIDLLLNPSGVLSAFAHELTHVVLADAFTGSQPPLWANEGIAILADSVEKQRLHRRDLNHSIQQQLHFHCAELVLLDSYPPGHRVPVFYGQCVSLVGLLTTLGGSEQLVPFLKKAEAEGYDKALRDFYGIEGLAELHRKWASHG
jgi:hypothetical protein